jgi:hypothetical protein
VIDGRANTLRRGLRQAAARCRAGRRTRGDAVGDSTAVAPSSPSALLRAGAARHLFHAMGRIEFPQFALIILASPSAQDAPRTTRWWAEWEREVVCRAREMTLSRWNDPSHPPRTLRLRSGQASAGPLPLLPLRRRRGCSSLERFSFPQFAQGVLRPAPALREAEGPDNPPSFLAFPSSTGECDD